MFSYLRTLSHLVLVLGFFISVHRLMLNPFRLAHTRLRCAFKYEDLPSCSTQLGPTKPLMTQAAKAKGEFGFRGIVESSLPQSSAIS